MVFVVLASFAIYSCFLLCFSFLLQESGNLVSEWCGIIFVVLAWFVVCSYFLLCFAFLFSGV